MIIVVMRIHLNWDTSLPSFPTSWDSLWGLPSCNTLLLWCASAFILRKGLSSGFNGKKKEHPISLPPARETGQKHGGRSLHCDLFKTRHHIRICDITVTEQCITSQPNYSCGISSCLSLNPVLHLMNIPGLI